MAKTNTEDFPEAKSRNIPCNSCGYRLAFAPGQMAWKCPQCFTENQIPAASAAECWEGLAELDLESALAAQFKTLPRQKMQFVSCSSCGAHIHLPTRVAAHHCPFCTMPMIVVQAQTEEMLLPSAVLPFRISAELLQALA